MYVYPLIVDNDDDSRRLCNTNGRRRRNTYRQNVDEERKNEREREDKYVYSSLNYFQVSLKRESHHVHIDERLKWRYRHYSSFSDTISI
jgi:hypothetical protein